MSCVPLPVDSCAACSWPSQASRRRKLRAPLVPRSSGPGAFGEGMHGGAVALLQHDVGESGDTLQGRDPAGACGVASRRMLHAARCVEQEVDREVFVLEEEPQEELVEALVEMPVDRPEVIARGVGAHVGELDARAARFGTLLRVAARGGDLPRPDAEGIEAGEEIGVEELFVGQGGLLAHGLGSPG
jgi:hypothetical protein